MVGGRYFNQYLVGGRWLMVGGLWSVVSGWSVVDGFVLRRPSLILWSKIENMGMRSVF